MEKAGGDVTPISMGDAESDEVLRRAIAMGAKDGFLVESGRPPLTTRWRGPACSIFPQERGRPLRRDLYGRPVRGRPVRVRRRHPRCKAGPALCLHGHRHRRLREGARRSSAGSWKAGFRSASSFLFPACSPSRAASTSRRYVSIMGIRKASKVERKVFKAGRIRGGRAGHDRPGEVDLSAEEGRRRP